MNRTFATTAFIAALSMPIAVHAAPIVDTYVGGNEHGYGDVIGDSRFQVTSFEMTRSGANLHVVINTNFAGYGDDALFSGSTRTPASARRGIGYGDVFLSNNWTPNGTAPYKLDDHAHGTKWTYGFALDNRWSATGGAGRLYALNGATNDSNTLLSNDFLSSGTFRDGQVIATSGADNTIKIWESETGDQQRSIENFGRHVTGVQYIGETDNIFSSCGDKIARIHNAANGGLARNFGNVKTWLHTVAITPDSTIATAGDAAGNVYLWNGNNGQQLKVLGVIEQ